MRALLLSALLGLSAGPALAADDLTALSDEFNGNELSADWTSFEPTFGWPDRTKTLDVGKTTPGALHVQPYDVAWVRDLVGPFLFKTVEGDFDVRARVRVRGKDGPIPGGTWSLGGILARTPNGNTADSWQPRIENWQFITTGVGNNPGEPMTETKATYNSFSSLKLRPFGTGWVELRMVRVGMAFVVLAREGGGPWQVRDRFYRMEHRPRMQVGLHFYTSSPDVPDTGPEDPQVINRTLNKEAKVDMLMDVDWIRYARPRLKAPADWYGQVSANPLADPNLTEAQILAMVGD